MQDNWFAFYPFMCLLSGQVSPLRDNVGFAEDVKNDKKCLLRTRSAVKYN